MLQYFNIIIRSGIEKPSILLGKSPCLIPNSHPLEMLEFHQLIKIKPLFLFLRFLGFWPFFAYSLMRFNGFWVAKKSRC